MGAVHLRVRGRLLVSAAGLLALALALALGAGAAAPKALCGALDPPRVRPPAWIPAAMSSYTYQLTANAQAHSGLCNVGLASPSDGYVYDVDVEVFPSHALAVADFDALDPHAAYRAIASQTGARGFPGPGFELVGTGLASGRPVSDVTFVDGAALVSAYLYGAGTLPRTLQLGQWARADIKAPSRRAG